MLLVAFASECLDRMKEGPARTHVEDLIREALRRIAFHPARGASRMTSAAKPESGVDVERSAPISPSSHSPRQAAGLPRQCRHFAKAARGDRRHFPLLRGHQRQYSSRRPLSFRARHRGARSRAQDCAEILNARARAKSFSSAAPPKASTSSRRPTAARRCRRATKC